MHIPLHGFQYDTRMCFKLIWFDNKTVVSPCNLFTRIRKMRWIYNTSNGRDASMRGCAWPTFIQITAYGCLATKPLSKSTM